MAATVADASEATNACWLTSRTWSSSKSGGMICSTGTIVSSVAIQRPSAWPSVMFVRTDTVVMFSLPPVSSVSAPSMSTTGSPPTSPSVSKVGPGPSAAYGTVRRISVPGMWSAVSAPANSTTGMDPQTRVDHRRFRASRALDMGADSSAGGVKYWCWTVAGSQRTHAFAG